MSLDAIYHAAVDAIRNGRPIVVCDGKVPLGGEQWHRQTVTEQSLPRLLRQAREPAIEGEPHSHLAREA